VKRKRIERMTATLPMKRHALMVGVGIKQADNVLVRIQANSATE
jgi:hypothetical protein